MSLRGCNFIGFSESAEGSEVFTAIDPGSGLPMADCFFEATDAEIDRAVALTVSSLNEGASPEQKAEFLLTVASNLEKLGSDLIDLAHSETRLPLTRLSSELNRTTGQMRLFADLVAEGSWVDARIDPAQPDRRPTRRPDFRRMLVPIGPVAVFGASNFPLAYSVAGGDTASAFAAGCPVIVKAHPAHPGTSELAAVAIVNAARSTGMPDGIFSMLHGGNHVGIELVRHAGVAAAGFTGSLAGGRALQLAANSRAYPIPVHAEMGSVNPVFLLPEATESRLASLVEELTKSVSLGTGQYCTNPGLIIAIGSPALDTLKRELASALSEIDPSPMLTFGIRDSYFEGMDRWESLGARRILRSNGPSRAGTAVCPSLYDVAAKDFLNNHQLVDEVFGPVTLVVTCADSSELLAAAKSIPGQLTASVHGSDEELMEYGDLIKEMTATVGRLIFNGYPTSVEVTPAMNHTGPYPACSDVRFTSVGTASIYRFARPLCWQDAPEHQLPPELRDSNPRNIRRMVSGVWVDKAVVSAASVTGS